MRGVSTFWSAIGKDGDANVVKLRNGEPPSPWFRSPFEIQKIPRRGKGSGRMEQRGKIAPRDMRRGWAHDGGRRDEMRREERRRNQTEVCKCKERVCSLDRSSGKSILHLHIHHTGPKAITHKCSLEGGARLCFYQICTVPLPHKLL